MKQRPVGLIRIWACCGLAACAWPVNASDLEADALDKLTVEQARKILATHRGVVSSQGMKLAYIPAGKFGMGSPRQEAGREAQEKVHEVELTQAFYLGTHQVTVGQFRKFVDDAKYRTEGERDGKGGWGVNEKGSLDKDGRFTWSSPGFKQTNDHPVVRVSWNDAQAYCRWLSKKENKTYRLPTEAEWEVAARAGTWTATYNGDPAGENCYASSPVLEPIAWYDANSGSTTHAVAQKDANAWGLHDMLGNVWEWTADWFTASHRPDRSDQPAVDPVGPPMGVNRVLKGGSFLCHDSYCHRYRLAARTSSTPDSTTGHQGFRIAT